MQEPAHSIRDTVWSLLNLTVTNMRYTGTQDFAKAHPGAIISTRVGFMSPSDDARKNPSYQEVCSGRTGHVEVLQLSYNPNKVSYEEICPHRY